MITKSWNNYLVNFPVEKKDIYFTEEYVKLYENEKDTAECFVYIEGDKTFLFPYLKRQINLCNGKYYDFETQYGYGGPVSNVEDKKFITRSLLAMEQDFLENNIVCGFVRFHPLLDNYKLFNSDFIKIINERKTVCVDLRQSLDHIWNDQIHSKHRNAIRKAESNSLKFEADTKFKYLDDFMSLYEETMKSLDADDFYYFGKPYYHKLIENMDGNVFLGIVKKDNKIISSAIFFKYNIYGHYHLAGSDVNSLELCPNNYLIYSAMGYLKSQGVKSFHLGGGTTNSHDNGLYKFKKRFSDQEKDFYIGKCKINSNVYDELIRLTIDKIDPKYSRLFLSYRYV